MYLCFLIILLLILILIYYLRKHPENFTQVQRHQVSYTNPQILQQLRTMLKDIDKIFRNHGIVYWIDGGTLLGAERDGDVILWDDDGDLSILKSFENKLLSLQSLLRRNGYGLTKVWLCYKIYPLNGAIIKPELEYRYPFVDIFMVEQIGDIFHYSNENVRKIWNNYYHESKDLLPLKEYSFSNFTLFGPQNPVPYLDRAFGKDWRIVGKKSYDHSTESPTQEIVFDL